MTLGAVAQEISRRLLAIFVPDEKGWRPWHGEQSYYRHGGRHTGHNNHRRATDLVFLRTRIRECGHKLQHQYHRNGLGYSISSWRLHGHRFLHPSHVQYWIHTHTAHLS